MFLQAATASARFSLVACVRVTRLFIFLTAASASPLDSGLCALESSCLQLFVLQNS